MLNSLLEKINPEKSHTTDKYFYVTHDAALSSMKDESNESIHLVLMSESRSNKNYQELIDAKTRAELVEKFIEIDTQLTEILNHHDVDSSVEGLFYSVIQSTLADIHKQIDVGVLALSYLNNQFDSLKKKMGEIEKEQLTHQQHNGHSSHLFFSRLNLHPGVANHSKSYHEVDDLQHQVNEWAASYRPTYSS